MSESCDGEFDESLEQVSGRARHSRVGGNPQGRVRVKQDKTTTNQSSSVSIHVSSISRHARLDPLSTNIPTDKMVVHTGMLLCAP